MAHRTVYRTQDLYFAAYLRTAGVELLEVEHPADPERVTRRPPPSVFVFVDDDIATHNRAWLNGTDSVSASEYANAVKTLKTAVMRRQ